MKLYFKKYGEGKPLIILHGLFGMSDNWMTLAKQFSENNFAAYTVDLRNHGRSPHRDEFNYDVMCDDLLELLQDEKIAAADFLGHSMGGKAAMFFAARHPALVRHLVVADMSPRAYGPTQEHVMAAIHDVNLDMITSRKEAEEQLRNSLHDEGTVQFLLKNLYRRDEGENAGEKFAWRFNLSAIEKNNAAIGVALPAGSRFDGPVLFVRGDRSGYITGEDEQLIKKHFPKAVISTVADAGHWVHAENPKGFMDVVVPFLV